MIHTARRQLLGVSLAWPALLGALLFVAATGLIPPGAVMEKLRLLHSGVDYHPDSTHSFFLSGQQSVICSRNTGIYTGALLTMAWAWAANRGRALSFPPIRIGIVLALFVGIMAADGFNSLAADIGYPSAYEPSNWLRLGTGLLAGAAIVLYFLPVLNSLLWREGQYQPVIGSPRSLGALLMWPAALWLLVTLHVDVVALPVALLTTTASLVLFGSLNLLFLTVILHRENRFRRVHDLLRPALASLALALAQLVALAFIVQRFVGLVR